MGVVDAGNLVEGAAIEEFTGRADAEPGIADRPGMPLVDSARMLSVGSFSLASSR